MGEEGTGRRPGGVIEEPLTPLVELPVPTDADKSAVTRVADMGPLLRRMLGSVADVETTVPGTAEPDDDAGMRSGLPEASVVGGQLLGEVQASIASLSDLARHAPMLGDGATKTIRATLADVERRMAKEYVSVLVVGEGGSGKRTFLNALFGERLLTGSGTASVTVTFIRKSNAPNYVARFADGTEYEFSQRVPDDSEQRAREIASASAARAAVEAEMQAASDSLNEAAAAILSRDAELAELSARLDETRATAARAAQSLHETRALVELRRAAAESDARAVPEVCRERPPWWAVWLWILRAIHGLFHREAIRAAERRAAELAEATGVSDTWQATLSDAEARRQETVALRHLAASAAEEAAKTDAASREALAGAEARLGKLREKVDRLEGALRSHIEQRWQTFRADLRAFEDGAAAPPELEELALDTPALLLPDDVCLIDVPGVAASSPVHRERAWNVVRHEADACIVIADLRTSVSSSTKAFIKDIHAIVPHVVLVLTKLDDMLEEALRRGEPDVWQRVDQARRIGARRFAQDVGRDPSTVLSIAVAAEATLGEDCRSGTDMIDRFESDTAKLFALLRHERALMLGTRCASALRQCIGGIREAEQRAERSYRERIARLEARRIPDPARFRAEQLSRLEGAIGGGARTVADAAIEHCRDLVQLVRVECAQRARACPSKRELSALLPELAQLFAERLNKAERDLAFELEASVLRAAEQLEVRPLEELRAQYGIVHRVSGRADRSLRLDRTGARPAASVLLPSAELRESTEAIGRAIAAIARSGAAGTLRSLLRTLDGMRKDTDQALAEASGIAERILVQHLQAAQPAIAERLRAELTDSLEEAAARFAHWIRETVESERAALRAEREGLANLLTLRAALEQHSGRMAELLRAARDASLGMCK